MQLTDYQTLIQQLPTHQQAFTAQRNTWENIAKKTPDFRSSFDLIFSKEHASIQISREDILDTENAKEKILKTIMWGYPRGMRGKHFSTIFREIPALAEKLKSYQGENLSKSEYEEHLCPIFDNTRGLGLSTYSKLLYFFEISISGHPCLILDERLLRSFQTGQFEELKELPGIPKYKPAKWYVDYLRVMNEQAKELDTKPEKLEQFLFLFGSHLKA